MNTFKINRSVGNHHQYQQDNNKLIDRNHQSIDNKQEQQQQPQRVSQSGLPPALKTEAPRQTGPESRVTGRETPVPPATARWVPPSLRPQHGLTQEIKNDTIYRKVRGILNKLTPEKFQNLSDELLKIDLNSPIILNGVILLIFEKALDEQKYSSMYAQLCKRLSDEAPNNDPPNGPTTFLRILLNVCRLKFFNRTTDNKTRDNQYITDDEERKLITKQKMLGNVKFIGELSKLDMLSIDTLHTCIFELLNKQTSANANNTATIQEKCEDMECLSQLIRTCGKKLDTEKGKILMDQYFEKMAYRSKSQKYPPRIRFMLRDVIELRRNNWIPRNVTNVEGPMPMDQLLPDDDIVVRPQYMNRNRMDPRNMDHDSSDNWMNKLPLNLQGGYMDVFSGYNMSSSSNLMSSYNNNSNNYNNRDHRDLSGGGGGGMNGGGGGGGMGGNSGYRMNNQRMNNQNNNYSNHRYNNNNNNNNNKQHNNNNNNSMMMMHNNMNSHNNSNYNNHMSSNSMNNNHNNNNHNNNNNNNNNNMNNNKDLAPRFKRNLIQSVTQDPVENLQFRPATNSLLYKPNLNINLQQLPLKQQPRPLNNSNDLSSSSISSLSSSSSIASTLLPITQTSSTIITSPMLNNNRQMNNHTNNYNATTGGGGNGQNNMMNNLNKENTMMLNNNMKNLSINAGGGGGGGGSPSTIVTGGATQQTGVINNNNNAQQQQQQVGKDQLLINKQPGSMENNNNNVNTKSKPKKDKGPSKEEIIKRILTFLNANLIIDNKNKKIINELNNIGEQQTNTTIINNITSNNNNNDIINIIDGSIDLIENQEPNMDDIVSMFIELKVPEKFMRDSITAIITEIIDKNELIHERTIEFLICLKRDGKLNSNAFIDGFKVVINSMNEINVPRIATIIASLLSRSVIGKLCKLSDISNYCDNGQHYPLFLLVLQQLHKTFGSKQKLIELFNESKINLMTSLYEADRNKERLAAILDDRNLSFLYPLLKVQGELHKQLQADSNPQQFYKWIKDNVDSSCFNDPGFITALMTVLLKFITQETTLAEGIDSKNTDKELIEREQALLKKYAPVLIVFLKKNYDLQLIAIYALQVFCYNVNFPKGMLLRWFSNLYELNVIEEDSFLRWKEDLSDVYMGKGKALFQVNNWLTWLEQAESEDDEEED